MNRLRTLLSVLLGLVLLAQGFAVSAAPYVQRSAAAATQSADGIPCHHSAAVQDDSATERGCCNDYCPDLSSCALAQLAPAPALVSVVLRASATAALPLASAPPRAKLPSSLLRPPISPHG